MPNSSTMSYGCFIYLSDVLVLLVGYLDVVGFFVVVGLLVCFFPGNVNSYFVF